MFPGGELFRWKVQNHWMPCLHFLVSTEHSVWALPAEQRVLWDLKVVGHEFIINPWLTSVRLAELNRTTMDLLNWILMSTSVYLHKASRNSDSFCLSVLVHNNIDSEKEWFKKKKKWKYFKKNKKNQKQIPNMFRSLFLRWKCSAVWGGTNKWWGRSQPPLTLAELTPLAATGNTSSAFSLSWSRRSPPMVFGDDGPQEGHMVMGAGVTGFFLESITIPTVFRYIKIWYVL